MGVFYDFLGGLGIMALIFILSLIIGELRKPR